MNLIKSFNFKYLKENVKKSKSIIILLLIVVPLLTTLFTVLFVNGEETVNLASELNINWVNMLGMYVVPIGISFALFGYIYKKNSVDLINSMPINKQTIFITNTIGGIILITLMQIITAVLLFICSLVLSNLVIFGKMLIDIFITMWAAYVFVFLATNLAMSISGTFLTQLVLTTLILFLVPFTIFNYSDYRYKENYKIVLSDGNEDYAYRDVSYTLPVQILISFFMSENSYSFNSLLKTMLLGILYLILGLILFKRRKMENTEESFRNEKVHLFVKALTVFPMITIINFANISNIIIVFIIAIISIYYFAYDFVVKRKVKFIVSVIALVITLGASYLVNVTIDKLDENILEPTRKIKLEDAKCVSINLHGNRWADNEIDSYFIYDKELLEFVKKIEERDVYKHMSDYSDSVLNYTVNVTYKTKNGKIVECRIQMFDDEISKLIELLSKDEKYVNLVKKEYITDGKICINDHVVSNEFEKEISLKVKDKINNMSLLEIYNELMNRNDSIYYSSLSKVYYSNHKYITKYLEIELSEEISKMIVDYQNERASEDIKKVNEKEVDVRCVNKQINFNMESNSFYNTSKEIIKFIKDNQDVKCDINQNFYQIYFYDWKSDKSGIFYTNKIDEVNEILRKEQSFRNEMIEDNMVETTEVVY